MDNIPEFKWTMKGFAPDTIPMARLAEYMQQLARLLGQGDAIHFNRLEKGSINLIARVDRKFFGKATTRVTSIKRGVAPPDALKAYSIIDAMVAEDGTNAFLRAGSAVVIRFPGNNKKDVKKIQVPDTGSLVGYLYMLYDAEKEFRARIRLESGRTIICAVNPGVVKRLKDCLFETVRVYGRGVWARDENGFWSVLNLEIDDAKQIDDSDLRTAVEKIRKLDIRWHPSSLEYFDEVNTGDGDIR